MFLRFYSRLTIATVSFLAMVPTDAINLGSDTVLPRPDSDPLSHQMAQLTADHDWAAYNHEYLAQTSSESDMILNERGKNWFDSHHRRQVEAKQEWKEKQAIETKARTEFRAKKKAYLGAQKKYSQKYYAGEPS